MPCVGDKFYEAVLNKRTQQWDVVWIRNGKDKPTLSRWLKEGDREARPASFSRREYAKEYMRLLAAGDTSRFKVDD